MNIKFIVSKRYNHFFFIQTLSDWHFSCRPQYIKKWLEDTGPLTEQEKKALMAFKSVMKKYGFKPIENCLAENGFDFLMRFDEFKEKSPFSKKEIEIYLNAMKSLETRFNEIWEIESKNLEKVEKLLNNKFNQSNDKVAGDLKVLFKNQIDLETKIEVILLLSTEDSGSGGGGANNGPNIVSLECSSINPKDMNYLLSTLWHEITHLVLGDYIKETASITKNNDITREASLEAEKIDFNYSEELLSFSLFSPMSFLTERYFQTEIAKQLSDSVFQEDTTWLLEARHIFIMYLIYLNGQFIQKMLNKNQSITPFKMANALIANHEAIKEFFLRNHKEPEWFN